jgi:predicted nucleic-acid-binding protein
MTGVDTNVLVRYFVRDDPDQAARADEWIDEIHRTGEKVFINSVVLCELVWVLGSVYKHPRPVIADVIERILNTVHFEVENHNLVLTSLEDYRLSRADFADCLIGRINSAAGCVKTFSFDQGAADLSGFEIL